MSDRDFLRLICKSNEKDQLTQIKDYLKITDKATKGTNDKKLKVIVLSLEKNNITLEKNNITKLTKNHYKF